MLSDNIYRILVVAINACTDIGAASFNPDAEETYVAMLSGDVLAESV